MSPDRSASIWSVEVAHFFEAVAAWEVAVESAAAGAPPPSGHALPLGGFNESQQKVAD